MDTVAKANFHTYIVAYLFSPQYSWKTKVSTFMCALKMDFYFRMKWFLRGNGILLRKNEVRESEKSFLYEKEKLSSRPVERL